MKPDLKPSHTTVPFKRAYVGAASFVHAVELETRAGVLVESVAGGVHAHQAVATLTPVSAAGRHVR